MNCIETWYSSFLLSLRLCVSLLIFTICSCKCNKGIGESANNLSMQISHEPLVGKATSGKVTFSLVDSTKSVALGEVNLKVTLQAEGGTESQISYHAGKVKTNYMQHSLKHVVNSDSLTNETPSVDFPFVFLPAENATVIIADFELINNKDGGVIQNLIVDWKKGVEYKTPILSLKSPASIKGNKKIIELKVENKEKQIEDKKLTLKIIRESGTKAIIKEATIQNNIYIVDLPLLTSKSSLSHRLTIDTQTDQEAKFSIQLQQEGIDIGDPIKVQWEQEEGGLQIGDFTYNKKTKKITYTVQNLTQEKITNIHLSYTSETPDVTIEGVVTKKIELGDLEPGTGKKVFELNSLNIGESQKIAVFTFNISYDQNTGTPITIKKVFKQADIQIGLNIQYNPTTAKVSYSLTNSGTDVAKELKLTYKNISIPEKNKHVTLGSHIEQELSLANLISTQEFTYTLGLNFKEAREATFRFTVEYEGVTIAEKEETFQEKPLKLSLDIISSEKNNTNHVLYGPNNKVQFKINCFDGNVNPINTELLKLVIKQQTDDQAIISLIDEGTGISELVGSALGTIGDTLSLYINPKQNAKEVNFFLQLYYKDEEVSVPIYFQWREYSLLIQGPTRFVEEVGWFVITNIGHIDPKNITLTISGDNGTIFELLKSDGSLAGKEANLSDCIPSEYTPSGLDNQRIKFKVTNSGNNKKSTATITAKRGASQLAQTTINWVAAGVDLEITTDQLVFEDNIFANIRTENPSKHPIDLREIKVIANTTESISISLDAIEGTTIQTTLASIVGKDELAPQEIVVFDLFLNNFLAKKAATGITLIFLDKEDNVLHTKYFICLDHKISQKAHIFREVFGDSVLTTELLKQQEPDFLSFFFERLQKIIKTYTDMVEKFDSLSSNNIKFKEIIQPFRGLFNNQIKQWEMTMENIKIVLADSPNTENYMIDLSKELENIIKFVSDKLQTTKALNLTRKSQEVKNILAAKYEQEAAIEEHSIRGLFVHYKLGIKLAETVFVSNNINDLNPHATDSNGVRQLKETYKKMQDMLPILMAQMQEVFADAFSSLKASVNIAQDKGKDFATHKNMGALFNNLKMRKISLISYDFLSKEDKIGVEPINFNSFLKESYTILLEHMAELIEYAVVEGNNKDLKKYGNLIMDILKDIKNTPAVEDNNAIKQLALKSAINVYTKLKDKKSADYKVYITATEAKTLQSIIQDLQEDLIAIS